VVAGIQTYISDSAAVHLKASTLNYDIEAAMYTGSAGYVLFKYGLVDSNIKVFQT